MRSPLPPVTARFLGPLLLLLLLASCGTTFEVEDRDVPVHVWITAPGLAAQGGTLDALIYVGARKVVEGPIRFPPGVHTVNLPPVHVRAGERPVSVVLQQGTISVREDVDIESESWIQVLVRGREVRLEHSEDQPDPFGG